MCGIAGFVTTERDKLRYERFKFLAQATYLNTLRGDDSTGLFYVPHAAKDQEVKAGYAKDIVPGNEFIWTEPYLSVVAKMENMAFMVTHNRAATQGTVTTANAHPFQEGPITLVHNGTVDNDWSDMHKANEKRAKDSQIVVDSHMICHNLANGDREDVIGHIQGGFALVWHDARDNNLYMIRNDRRPFHIAQAKDNDTTYFMSEAEMLYTICRRNHINIGRIYEPDPGVLLRFENGKIKPIAKKVKIGMRRKTDFDRPAGGTGSRAPFTRGTTTSTTRRKNRNAGFVVDTTDSSNNIWVGGRMQAIPMAAQEHLLKRGFLIEDRFLMRPIEFKKYAGTNKKGLVLGEAHCGMHLGSVTVVVHGVDEERYANIKDNLWAIRPIAINEMDNGYVVIARPLSTDSDAARRIVSNYVAERLMKQQPPKEEDEGAESDIPFSENSADRFIGPNGVIYTFSEMKVLMESGCHQCGKELTPWDAEDVIWVCDSRHPVCKACTQEWAEMEERLHTDPADMR